jgi:hypothetical protein
LKKVNKKRTVTVRRIIIFLNISRHPLLIFFTLLSSSVQNSEGAGDGDSGDSFADPCQEFKQGFLGGFQWSPPCLIIIKDMYKYIRG